MSNSPFQQVETFMLACNQTVGTYNKEQAELYEGLVYEELQEWKDAKGDYGYRPIDDLDAVCDLVWVLVGYAKSMGYNIEGAFSEVVRSNMSKVDSKTGKVLKREDGKVLKPDSYSPPQLAKFI